jgi:hypothetical protein
MNIGQLIPSMCPVLFARDMTLCRFEKYLQPPLLLSIHTILKVGANTGGGGGELWSYYQDVWILYRVTLLVRINRISGNCYAQIRAVAMFM